MQKQSFHTAKKYLWLFYALNIALLVFAAIQLAGAGAGEKTTPEILGARDLTYCVGQTPAYFRGVRVAGNGDAGVVLKVDSTQVDMTTEGTVNSGLFSRALMAEGIHPVIPGKQSREQIDHLIYRNIKAGIRPELERFHTAEEALRRNGAEVVIPGSPELTLIRAREHIGKGFLDVIQMLAAQAVPQCGGIIRQPYEELFF